MSDIQEQISSIEKEIRETPYHKATEHHIGRLRAKLARLREKQFDSQKKSKGGSTGYAVKKQGDATVVLVGPPSVGKSTLLNKLTNAKSKVAPYAFTTVSVIPGMMIYKNAKIQILDVPGLIKGAEEGKGRGREVLSIIRGCDLLCIITDIDDTDAIERISKTLDINGVRINQERPNVSIDKKAGGGIIIHSNLKQNLGKDTIKEVAQQFGIRNAEITIKELLSIDRLVDAFSSNRVYIPAIYVINKTDLAKKIFDENGTNDINHLYKKAILKISAEKNTGLFDLKQLIWKGLKFSRVYLIKKDEVQNFNNPIVMKSDSSLYDVAKKIGDEFAEEKKRAKIWGPGSKYSGQEVSLKNKVVEGMQIRFI